MSQQKESVASASGFGKVGAFGMAGVKEGESAISGATVEALSEFRFFNLGSEARFALSAGLFAFGAILGLALTASIFPGLVVGVLGWFPLMLRKATNKPNDQGLEEWRPVGMADVDRLSDSLVQSKKLAKKTKSKLAPLLWVILPVPIFIGFVLFGLAMGRTDISYLLAFGLVYVVPALFFGRIRVHMPKDISLKMPCFKAVLEIPLPEGINLVPYIRFDKDDKGADVPEDLRLMFELKRPPADLVGIQLQAALNNGANGIVPYLYAVVLTRGTEGSAHGAAARLKVKGYEIEAGGDEKYGTVVIRQDTGGGGYYTTPGDCSDLARICLAFLERLKKTA